MHEKNAYTGNTFLLPPTSLTFKANIMKKLLFQLDTDLHPAVFDAVVAYDGGADHVIGHGGVTPKTVASLVEGAIFTRAPKDKKNTALFIGGSDLAAGEALLQAIKAQFFLDFRVSVMLDSNGCNTTAAAAVAKLATSGTIAGKRAVVLAGSGPVGQRAAVMLAKEGANVTLTSRQMSRAQAACQAMKERFGVDLEPIEAADNAARGKAIEGAQIVFATGSAGTQLLNTHHWQDNSSLELMADANTTPPLGIEGIDMMDRGTGRNGKIVWGALGFGALKLKLQRACIGKLFESNDQILDAEEIFAIAKTMA
jgi:methylenetetrahydrofolate/methylenetetrahydromethanopterin dehydrogenase (NADP+)